jgi:predicted PurR-regulated permease PerM
MTSEGGSGSSVGPAGVVVPDHVVVAVQEGEAAKQPRDGTPGWVGKFAWSVLWKAVAVILVTLVFLALAWRAQTLLRMLGVSVFFALAMIPAVKYMHERWGWKRGAAVGAIYAGLVVFLVLMVVVLIPAIVTFADQVNVDSGGMADKINSYSQDLVGRDVIAESTAADAAETADTGLTDWAENLVGVATVGIGFVFNMMTVLLFTFYFAADAPRIERALLSRMPAHRQQVTGWIWDTAIEQTGGYFYSRMLLMLINGGLFFVAMLLVGMPLAYALPLSSFEGFVAEFIPAVGTYIGAAVPILLTLVVGGLVPALILLVWVLIYQQAENYWLSPKLSAQTMTLNGGVAFGAALAGGAIAGPMGAFMALPVAALITSIISNTGKTYDVVYQSDYDAAHDQASALPDGGDAAAPA